MTMSEILLSANKPEDWQPHLGDPENMREIERIQPST